jgi:hypothetical protein
VRFEIIEIHEQPWFPDFLRREVMDALQMVLEVTNAYRPIAERLRLALARADARQVLDLFSGAGGPWPSLIRSIESGGGELPEVYLTDKFPNTSARAGGGTGAVESRHIHFVRESLDANAIPDSMAGFRTIFSSFHHFSPAQAREFLKDSAGKRRGIGVFEVASRRLLSMASIFFIPVVDWIFTPFRRPFRWSRVFWTYIVPVVPSVLLVDGLSSCLRTYSLADLRGFADGLAGENYNWEIGESEAVFPPVRVTYLIGWPKDVPVGAAD